MSIKKVILLDEANGVQLWHTGDGIGILSFQSKANCASLKVLLGIQKALQIGAKQLTGIILWQESDKFFCVGADLSYVCSLAESHDLASIRHYLATFQATALQLRYSPIPIIAAVRGYALGGGCELAMHCAQIVAAKSAHIGLVETSIGLVPSGGGSKELVLRASSSEHYQAVLTRYFSHVATGKMSIDAMEAKQWGYLRMTDWIVEDTIDLLKEAKKALLQLHYVPPSSPIIPVFGERERVLLLAAYESQADPLSAHDKCITEKLAVIFSGGPHTETNTEQALLSMELNAFLELVQNPLSLARIHYTLKTGKYLRN